MLDAITGAIIELRQRFQKMKPFGTYLFHPGIARKMNYRGA
jgi:hypothetical protein